MENQSATTPEHTPIEEHALSQTQHPGCSLAVSLAEMLKRLSPVSPNCCIYRVNSNLRQVNQKAYTPKVVSIGPLHRGNEELQAMEEHKLRYLQTFLCSASLAIEDCVNLVRNWEAQARNCYAETIEQTSDEFAKVILVDGCFVVMVLMFPYFPQLIQEGDRLFFVPYFFEQVFTDMALLENQLPFFLSLYNFFISSTKLELQFPSIWNLVYAFFKPVIGVNKPPEVNGIPQVSHFVDVIRFFYQPISETYHQSISQTLGSDPEAIYSTPSATHLHAAGVKFESVTGSSPMDIGFADGVLKIPNLDLKDSTEIIFRNLLAFEQLHSLDGYITAYLCLLDKLIDTPQDVDLLVQGGVIRNMLGSNEDACKLFNNISTYTYLSSEPYFFSICKDLQAYCKTPWHKWKAALKREYLSTPWKVLGITVAFLLLILTFIQAVCSLLSS